MAKKKRRIKKGRRGSKATKNTSKTQALQCCSPALSSIAEKINFEAKFKFSPDRGRKIYYMNRGQAVKLIWQYVKQHNLKDPDPSNKTGLVCDSLLHQVFRKRSVGFFEVNSLLSPHLQATGEVIESGGSRNPRVVWEPSSASSMGAGVQAGPPTTISSLHPSLRRSVPKTTHVQSTRVREALIRQHQSTAISSSNLKHTFDQIKQGSQGAKKDKTTGGGHDRKPGTLTLVEQHQLANITMSTEERLYQPSSTRLCEFIQQSGSLGTRDRSRGLPENDYLKMIAKYCKEHKLRDKKDRSVINCDQALKTLFKVDFFPITDCRRLLSDHLRILPSDSQDASSHAFSSSTQMLAQVHGHDTSEDGKLPEKAQSVCRGKRKGSTILSDDISDSSECEITGGKRRKPIILSDDSSDSSETEMTGRMTSAATKKEGIDKQSKLKNSPLREKAELVTGRNRLMKRPRSTNNLRCESSHHQQQLKKATLFDPNKADKGTKCGEDSSRQVANASHHQNTQAITRRGSYSTSNNKSGNGDSLKSFVAANQLDPVTSSSFIAWVHQHRPGLADEPQAQEIFEDALTEWVCTTVSAPENNISDQEKTLCFEEEKKGSASDGRVHNKDGELLVCCICLEGPRNAALVHGESGHAVCCFPCASELKKKKKGCPICRQRISKVIKLFG